MKVTREWMTDFDFVVRHMAMSSIDIEECKQEARDNPEWALDFYPRAASSIRAGDSSSLAHEAACDA